MQRATEQDSLGFLLGADEDVSVGGVDLEKSGVHALPFLHALHHLDV